MKRSEKEKNENHQNYFKLIYIIINSKEKKSKQRNDLRYFVRMTLTTKNVSIDSSISQKVLSIIGDDEGEERKSKRRIRK